MSCDWKWDVLPSAILGYVLCDYKSRRVADGEGVVVVKLEGGARVYYAVSVIMMQHPKLTALRNPATASTTNYKSTAKLILYGVFPQHLLKRNYRRQQILEAKPANEYTTEIALQYTEDPGLPRSCKHVQMNIFRHRLIQYKHLHP